MVLVRPRSQIPKAFAATHEGVNGVKLMEIDKTSSMHKETAWKIKLDKNILLTLNAIEDSSLPEPNVSVILSEGDKKVSFTMTKDKFLNLTGVLDSFSQVCLGVEPVLAQEEYAPRETRAPEKKAEKVEPPAAPRPKLDKMEAPATPAKKVEGPRTVPATPAKQPEALKASSQENGMMSKIEAKAPPKIAFPPRFPSAATLDDDEMEAAEKAQEAEVMAELDKLDFTELDASQALAKKPAESAPPAQLPPTKPNPPTLAPKITVQPQAPPKPQKEPEDDAAPEWDPW